MADLFPDKTDVDIKCNQESGDHEADAAVKGTDLKSQKESEREDEIETDQGSGMSDDLQHDVLSMIPP